MKHQRSGGRLLIATLLAACSITATAQNADMSFFVTSAGPGDGANLGGLAGADAHCARLAADAGASKKQWRAYLSIVSIRGDSSQNISARDRIGTGPWQNAKGETIAKSVDDLHSADNNLTKQTALNEKGEPISGRGDPVNRHDILTGSDTAGRYLVANGDTTCGNWTKNGEGSAIVGHSDRVGLNDTSHMKSWVAAHGTRGCDQKSLQSTGGDGLFYCFATD
ncbi:MAG: hypothetical protein R3E87_05125 [Burkholderiaceae bacterium]